MARPSLRPQASAKPDENIMSSFEMRNGKVRAQIKIAGKRTSATFESMDDAKKWADSCEKFGGPRPTRDKKKLPNINPRTSMIVSKEIIADMSEPFSRICCVYFLMNFREITYVGQTVDLFGRLSAHSNKSAEFTHYAYIQCEPRQLDNLETFYILKFKPRYNKKINDTLPTPTSINDPLLQKLLK
jgi:hypothetical protein